MNLSAKRLRILSKVCAGALVLAGAGFVVFATSIDRSSRAFVEKAEGIIALTGGASRISEAVKLLRSGKGERLLITGVNPSTSRKMLQNVLPRNDRLFDCCIDIDHIARDTIGNADAARTWVAKNGFDSIIVVTSSYHMPRSLVELRMAMPTVKLVPFPVVSKRLRGKNWWFYPQTLRLLATEYIKFLPAIARLGVARIGRSVSLEPSISASAGNVRQNQP